jgi:hypothetical protein
MTQVTFLGFHYHFKGKAGIASLIARELKHERKPDPACNHPMLPLRR